MLKSVIASTLGITLLVSGGTYALWDANITPGTAAEITTGEIKVLATDSLGWFDISTAEMASYPDSDWK